MTGGGYIYGIATRTGLDLDFTVSGQWGRTTGTSVATPWSITELS